MTGPNFVAAFSTQRMFAPAGTLIVHSSPILTTHELYVAPPPGMLLPLAKHLPWLAIERLNLVRNSQSRMSSQTNPVQELPDETPSTGFTFSRVPGTSNTDFDEFVMILSKDLQRGRRIFETIRHYATTPSGEIVADSNQNNLIGSWSLQLTLDHQDEIQTRSICFAPKWDTEQAKRNSTKAPGEPRDHETWHENSNDCTMHIEIGDKEVKECWLELAPKDELKNGKTRVFITGIAEAGGGVVFQS